MAITAIARYAHLSKTVSRGARVAAYIRRTITLRRALERGARSLVAAGRSCPASRTVTPRCVSSAVQRQTTARTNVLEELLMSDVKYVELHGDRVAYREAGSGDVVVLIHGMAGSSQTWEAVLPRGWPGTTG